MSFFCFTGGRTSTKRRRDEENDKSALTIVKSEKQLDAWKKRDTSKDQLAVICWSAAFSSLHSETKVWFEDLALRHCGEATYAIVDVDRCCGSAREGSVYNLPSFHILHRGILIERLEGLSSISKIPPVLQNYYNGDNLAQGSSAKSSAVFTETSCSGQKSSGAAGQSNPENSNHSGAKPCHRSNPSLTSEPESCASFESDRTIETLQRKSELNSASSPSSYLPKFIMNRSLSLSKRNWEPNTEFGVYQFR